MYIEYYWNQKKQKFRHTFWYIILESPFFLEVHIICTEGMGVRVYMYIPTFPRLLQEDFVLFLGSLTYFCTFCTWCETKMAAIYSNLDDLLQK